MQKLRMDPELERKLKILEIVSNEKNVRRKTIGKLKCPFYSCINEREVFDVRITKFFYVNQIKPYLKFVCSLIDTVKLYENALTVYTCDLYIKTRWDENKFLFCSDRINALEKENNVIFFLENFSFFIKENMKNCNSEDSDPDVELFSFALKEFVDEIIYEFNLFFKSGIYKKENPRMKTILRKLTLFADCILIKIEQDENENNKTKKQIFHNVAKNMLPNCEKTIQFLSNDKDDIKNDYVFFESN